MREIGESVSGDRSACGNLNHVVHRLVRGRMKATRNAEDSTRIGGAGIGSHVIESANDFTIEALGEAYIPVPCEGGRIVRFIANQPECVAAATALREDARLRNFPGVGEIANLRHRLPPRHSRVVAINIDMNGVDGAKVLLLVRDPVCLIGFLEFPATPKAVDGHVTVRLPDKIVFDLGKQGVE